VPVNVRVVDQYDDAVFKDLVRRNLESGDLFIPAWEYQTAGDSTFQLTARQVRIGAFDGDRLIGLSCGGAWSKSRFVMNMSLVERDYRGQGIYGRMLALMLAETKEFDEVDSWHQIFNNSIIATKLKRGFHIVGMDHSLMVGPRVQLRFFHNTKLLELMRFRVGLRSDPRPDFVGLVARS
jgi:hypothetical protein